MHDWSIIYSKRNPLGQMYEHNNYGLMIQDGKKNLIVLKIIIIYSDKKHSHTML